MVAIRNKFKNINFSPEEWIKKPSRLKASSFKKLAERKFLLDGVMLECMKNVANFSSEAECVNKTTIARKALKKVRLSTFQVVILRIVNFVVRIFKKDFSRINDLLKSNKNANRLIRVYSRILNPAKPPSPSKSKPKEIPSLNNNHTQYGLDVNEPSSSAPATVIERFNAQKGYLEKIASSIALNDKSAYDVSFETLANQVSKTAVEKPITVTMVAAEYAGLCKVGGLAEAVEGMSRGLLQQNPQNKVKLIFPKYSVLPEKVIERLSPPETLLSSKGEQYQVYRCEIDGVECQFIDHPVFDLGKGNTNIYASLDNAKQNRFAVFGELAADFIYEKKDSDIVHLHDWHVAGVALKLKKDHPAEWERGETPPIVFTFHNNGRSSQGRTYAGPYSYDPIIQGYKESGIIDGEENLFVLTSMVADGMTTVSEKYAIEAQQVATGEGVSFAVRQAAKVGKLVGIINGTSTTTWNPENEKELKEWKDVDSGVPVDLSYGPAHADIQGQKEKSKAQLQKWVEKYVNTPEFTDKADFPAPVKIDFNKPLVGYIGRFDSYQKGLDKFEEAIESTLKNGGQFICMGSAEDAAGKKILDELQEKYKDRGGVLFIRDSKEGTNWKIQQGTATRPGIGKLVRAALDLSFIPSKFEPCGLVQFESWLYGSLAIGSDTGGLADTIIPIEQDSDRFNGFKFQRDGNRAESAGAVVGNALKFWASKTHAEKSAISKRLIEDGRQYGWNSSPNGTSPAEKYRYTYENALNMTKARKASVAEYNKLEAVRKRIFTEDTAYQDSAEEHYLREYYSENKQMDSAALSELYRRLPKAIRQAVPSPYGVNVDFTAHQKYGSFPTNGATQFSVAAPNANEVKVVLYNADETIQGEYLMEKDSLGNWKTEIMWVGPGQLYQYKINGAIKLDPYARQCKMSVDDKKLPYTVVSTSEHAWSDQEWMKLRAKNAGKSLPMSIYEIHPLHWKTVNGKPLNYRELAHELVEHCAKVGYTHVELMGILEHMGNDSMGCYRVSGYFAPTSRMGTVDDFKYLVDHLHKNSISVVLDWVPAHFSADEGGLSNFDGSSMYEPSGAAYQLSIRNNFFKFGSKHFDFNKKSVREFLISSAAFWTNEMHIDGLRVDCVRSLLSTENKKTANLFMRDLNAVVHKHGEGAITIAEEYSGNTHVTASPYREGLGFDMKWHVGWMEETMKYFQTPPNKRHGKYEMIEKAIGCDNFHKQIMFFSHDDVKEKLGALINKTPGLTDKDQRYANARAMMSFMMCSPGKKLYFMGTEFGSETVWTDLAQKKEGMLDKQEQDGLENQQLMAMLASFNALYREKKALYEYDENGKDIEWIGEKKSQVHAYRRNAADGSSLACFHNFTGEAVKEFTVTLDVLEGEEHKYNYDLVELINTDDTKFGGKGAMNAMIVKREEIVTAEAEGDRPTGKLNKKKVRKTGIEEEKEKVVKRIIYTISVPPLSTVIIKEKEALPGV